MDKGRLNHSTVNESLNTMSIEQSTNPQFVPIFKPTREVKLVYSEYKKPDEKAKFLKK